MQTSWLIRKHRPACIIFFAGWGMDPAPFSSLASACCDVRMVYDYRLLAEPEPEELLPSGYDRLYLIAWSMGVWAAGVLLADFRQRFAAAIAVNGTLTPVDAERGISDLLLSPMIENFTPRLLEEFYRSMFDNPAEYRRFYAHRPQRQAEDIRLELINLRLASLELGAGTDIFSSRLVGSRDRIFTSRNQVRSWGRKKCTVCRMAHFPFYHWPDWDSIVNGDGDRATG